ncbi:LysR family transcriptional regulator [Hydrogenophaga sp. BPS33]|nr:LysR family transcriptional regulator [Hydrogenophaga sp. BPS33]
MRRVTFDTDAMRSFVLGIELGSFAQAADRLGRSTSAISAQLKRLEEQAGTSLVRKVGRQLVLTEAGETMFGYARRMLDLNDEAAMALREAGLEGGVRLGLQEDFGEMLLADVLTRFARAYPKVKMEARVARNRELTDAVQSGKLDLAVIWGDAEASPLAQRLADVPMRWVGGVREGLRVECERPLPIVAFDPPCLFRQAATVALDRAGIAWRSAFTSPNLGGLWAATAAGLGVTVRTGIELPPRVRVLNPVQAKLPPLPSIPVVMLRHSGALAPPAAQLAAIVSEAVREATQRSER